MTGNDMRARREALQFTQNQMADHLGITRRAYQMIEADGEGEVRGVYRVASERVSLWRALELKNPMLAVESVRADALDLAAMIRGTGAAG